MSYILDALKKAESERNLGSVPSIHAAPDFPPQSIDRTPAWRRPWVWVVILALLPLLGALAWLQPWRTAPAPPASAAASRPAPPDSAALPPTSVPPPPAASQTTPSPQVAEAPPEPKPRKAAPSKPAKPKEKPASPAPESTQEEVAGAPVSRTTKAAAPDNLPSKEERVAARHELPAAIQREIPPIAVNGYIYSPNKADRTVLINGKLLREGDRIAPDFELERLTPSGMVLNFKGYRYRASY